MKNQRKRNAGAEDAVVVVAFWTLKMQSLFTYALKLLRKVTIY